jgi:hypothetical protein
MKEIVATIPALAPPAWAVLERRLFDILDRAVEPFLEKYCRVDGSLIWRDQFPGRDGGDDFYESFYNWPLLYLLGGSNRILALAENQWEAVTRQLAALGHVANEYEIGYDWFHQGEANLFFYFLCLANPDRPVNHIRARRFAGLYLNEEPGEPNYDARHCIIRAPHSGSGGPRWGFFDGEPSYGWSARMAGYGLPFDDVPGVATYDDLKDPALAGRMGEEMQRRMGRGDVVSNLLVTSLVTNAYLVTGDGRYRDWVVEYVDAWVDRARRNGGLLPDNVGISGVVGEDHGGKWYGGLYGWTWPHGFYNVAMAAIVAAQNAYLLTRDPTYLDLPRTQIDQVYELGEWRNPKASPMSLREHWVGQFAGSASAESPSSMFLVPYRRGDVGWFDYQPLAPMYPVAVWHLSLQSTDWERIERVRSTSGYDWQQVHFFRTKEDAGHEPPWLRFLAGENPSYPEAILAKSLGQVAWRLEQIRRDEEDLAGVSIHHWQELNPVLTEALIQLTLGAPAPIYNGGLLFAPVRYFDRLSRRPGLPPDVAALVRDLHADGVRIDLVNLSPFATREVVVQAGAFAEHNFTAARYSAIADSVTFPGPVGAYIPSVLETSSRTVPVRDRWLAIRLPPGTQIILDVGTERFVHDPTYRGPAEID